MKLKVQADFRCYPVWKDDDGLWLDIDPASLPISEGLASDLNDWAAAYDATFNEEYPPDSGFADQAAEDDFLTVGRQLTNRLAQELGADAQVDFAGA